MKTFTLASAIKFGKIRTNRFFEGEGDGEGGGEGGGAGGEGGGAGGEGGNTKPPKAGDTNPNTGKKFTQDEVNRMMKQEKDKNKTERDRLQAELQRMKDEGLTTENMQTLQNRIDSLQNEGKTAEERAKDALSKKDKEMQEKLGLSQNETKKWRSDYEKYRAENEIIVAASKYKADNPSQIHRLLRNDVVYVEKLDANNKGTGEWFPKVRMEVEKDGEIVTLDLTPDEAVKKMTEMDEHKNLFNSGASSGLGGNNRGGSNNGRTAVPKDMAGYMSARKKNPNFLNEVGKEKK